MIMAVVSNLVHILSVHIYAFLLKWEWNVGTYDTCMFNLIRNCQKDNPNGCVILHSQQQCMRVPAGP